MVANGPRAEPFARLPRTQLRRIIALRLPPRVTVHRTRTERDTAARSFAIDAWLGRALVEPTGARAELLARVRAPATDGAAARARLHAACCVALAVGIADDDYRGFEESAEAILAAGDPPPDDDPDAALLCVAGALVARQFRSLDDPSLASLVERIVDALPRPGTGPAVRACAGMAALAWGEQLRDLERLLWIELAMRAVLADPALETRLRDEWHGKWLDGIYHLGDAARIDAARRAAAELATPVRCKQLLQDAQVAIGESEIERGRALLAQAEPLLAPSSPHTASVWHFLASRLAMLDPGFGDALVHARLALRLGADCRYPERWMGPIVMQEGQVLVQRGEHAAAVPFFERAGRASSGSQADYCWCLAHFARALDAAQAADEARLRAELGRGFALAQRLAWQAFFRANPAAASQLCALALERDIEVEFVRGVIAARRLAAVRAEVAAWPWPIRVRTLGRFAVEVGDTALAVRGKAAKKPLELLQFLIACGSQQVAATSVEFALWPDLEGDNAHAASKIALHRLRRLLGDDAAIAIDAGRLSLNPRLVWVDCLAFEALADALPALPLAPAQQAAAERALALYAGPFLGNDDDHSWQLVHRERLASKHRRLVRMVVAQARERADVAPARRSLERALELDPLDEDLLRELLQLLADAGEHGAALARYERWRAMCAKSLGVEPAASTQALAALLRAASTPAREAVRGRASAP